MSLIKVKGSSITGALAAVDGSSLTGISAGITFAQTWRLSTNFSGSQSPINANLKVSDTSGYATLGTGTMTESSGVFTFPSTGIYYIVFTCELFDSSNTSRYNNCWIQTTVDNGSNWIETAKGTPAIMNIVSSSTHTGIVTSCIFDVTDTTQRKVRFASEPQNSSTNTYGDSQRNFTHFQFIRLGDT